MRDAADPAGAFFSVHHRKLTLQIETAAVVAALAGMLIVLGRVAVAGWAQAGVSAGAIAGWAAYLFADRFLLGLASARALSPREAPFLQAIVRELAAFDGRHLRAVLAHAIARMDDHIAAAASGGDADDSTAPL
jgi:hypothetical protein